MGGGGIDGHVGLRTRQRELSQLPSDDEEEVAAARHPWADFFHHGNVHVSRLESLYDVNVRVIQSADVTGARAR